MSDLRTTTVFVSSVIESLEDYRQAVVDVANRLNLDGYRFNVVRADKELPASNFNPVEACYEGIDRSEICLCILGSRYGHVHPDTNLSISEMEFEYAMKQKRGILVFVLECDMEDRQVRFKERVEHIVSGKFRKRVASIGALQYESDQALRAWGTVKPAEEMAQVFASYSSRLLDGITNQLPAPIGELERAEVPKVLDLLSTDNSVLLLGDRGSGKSGVLKAVCREAQKEGVPILALAPATYPRDATTLTFLEQSLPVATTSLAGGLLEVANAFGHVYVVADQLDFVRGTNLARTLVHMLSTLSKERRISVLAACRTFDSQSDDMLILRASRFAVVEVPPLTAPHVRDLLRRAGLEDEPTEALLQLGSNLLLLSLIIDLIQRRRSVQSLVDDIDLWESFAESLRTTEGQEAFGHAIALAQESLLGGRADLVPDLPLDAPTQRLIAAGVLTHLPLDRVKFRHEEFELFLYGWHTVRNGISAADMASSIGPQLARRVFPYVQSLKRRLGPEHEAAFLREVFEVTNA